MAKYKYTGDGAGIPGLPHEITDEQAKKLGVKDTLAAAVVAGSYKKVTVKKAKPAMTALEKEL